MVLSELKDIDNSLVKILSIDNIKDEILKQKFKEIGIAKNNILQVTKHSKFNNKIIFIKSYDVEYAIRLEDAKLVKVELIK